MLMIYDGLCGFCNGSVRWLIKRDRFDRFRFAPQQSKLAEGILQRHGIDRTAIIRDNSVYLVTGLNSPQERVLVRSDVTVHALLELGGFWRVLGWCMQIVPRFMRDGAYRIIARNRFRLAGRYDVCPLPTTAERQKFVGITDL
jgi:predicted DCC family thiol-disulfide oxidoreductase YuxK